MSNKIFRGDSTAAFHQNWLRIEAEYPSDWVVTRCDFKVGNLPVMTFENPDFPIDVNLTSSQTKLLKDVNSCYLSLYDENELKLTAEGTFIFETRKQVT